MDENTFLKTLTDATQIYLDIVRDKRVKIFNLPSQSNWYHVYRLGAHMFSIYEHFDDLLDLYEYRMQLGDRPVFIFHVDNQKNTELFKALHELNMLCISKFNKQPQPIIQQALTFIKRIHRQK